MLSVILSIAQTLRAKGIGACPENTHCEATGREEDSHSRVAFQSQETSGDPDDPSRGLKAPTGPSKMGSKGPLKRSLIELDFKPLAISPTPHRAEGLFSVSGTLSLKENASKH